MGEDGAWERQTDGTRFRVFPQSPFGKPDAEPETIHVSTPAGAVRPGPSDDRMYFVWPKGKFYPYGVNTGPLGTKFMTLPPWTGPAWPDVQPGPNGHFDHLEVGTPEFEAAHLFGVTRFVMDVWETYLGHPIRWHFGEDYERLELTILPDWDNGQIGYGYLEVGSARRKDGKVVPFSLDFDIIAHEVGHGIIYSEVGLPDPNAESGEYFGFHEAAADWVAMIASLHFPSVVRDVLELTSGNLYTYNEFNRFSELSENEQIRSADNTLKLSDFADGWHDEHKLSEPLSGALFDIFVDIFHEVLVETGTIRRNLEDLADAAINRPDLADTLQAEFDAAFAANPDGFVVAIVEARDLMGKLLVESWRMLSPDDLNYADFADCLIAADAKITGGVLEDILITNFWWRDIGMVRAGVHVGLSKTKAHSHSSRVIQPALASSLPAMTYRERRFLRSISYLR